MKHASPPYTLAVLATFLNAELQGDAYCEINRLAEPASAGAGDVVVLHRAQWQKQPNALLASAVVGPPDLLAHDMANVLVVPDPYAAYVRLAHLFAPSKVISPGIHPTAVIAENAHIDASADIGPFVVIGADCMVGANTKIAAHCVLGEHVHVGKNAYLHPKVCLVSHVVLGDEVIIHSGTVIGSDGFGYYPEQGQWHKIPQLGRVVIESGVEIGANCTIDCAALGETHIARGVKIDNQVQVGHNVHIGEHTIIAGCTGIAGSTRIGAHCVIGGGVGLADHIEIADHVTLTGGSAVTKSIREAGVYSSTLGSLPLRQWQKNAVRFRQLDDLAKALKQVTKEITRAKTR